MSLRQTQAQKLRETRIGLGISKAEAARRIGIPYTTYDSYESGYRKPKIGSVLKIAEWLDVDVRQMLNGNWDTQGLE